jgi:delta24-sterol reductase
MTALERSIAVSDAVFDVYPLLVYPCRIYNHNRGARGQGQIREPRTVDLVPGHTDYAMFYDLGVYGVPGPVKNKLPYNPVTAYRVMEEVQNVCGGVGVYLTSFLSNKTLTRKHTHTHTHSLSAKLAGIPSCTPIPS